MTTQCCERCDGGNYINLAKQTFCNNESCPCHQSTNNIQGWEERYHDQFSGGSFGLTNKQYSTLQAFIASEIQKAEVRVLEEVIKEIDATRPRASQVIDMSKDGYYRAGQHDAKNLVHKIIRDHIKQQNVPSNLSTNQSGE